MHGIVNCETRGDYSAWGVDIEGDVFFRVFRLEKQKRYALPNSRIMIHQPSGGAQGQATDIEIQAREILALRERLNNIYVKHTGQELETIEQALERDKYMSPEEAADFGLIDEVVFQRPESEEDEVKN